MLNKTNIMILLKGGIISQILPLLSYPVITRLFSAENFGIYNTLLSIITTITVVSVLKLDQALPISSISERKKLLRTGFFTCISLNLFIFIILVLTSQMFEIEGITISLIILMSLSIIFNGLINLLIGLNITVGNFKSNANNQILRTFILTFLQITFGILGYLEFGLILAFVFAQFISFIFLVMKNKNELRGLFYISLICKDFKLIWRKYRDFPTYLTSTSLINTLGVTLPIMLITATYGLFFSGLYGLVSRAFMSPLNIISTSISQPFFKELADNKESKLKLQMTVTKVLKILALISIFPITIFTFNLEYIFGVVFSEEWTQAGIVAVSILPWITMNFILSPLTHVYTVLRKQNINLYFNIFTIILRTTILISSYILGLGFFKMILLFGLVSALITLSQIFVITKIALVRPNNIFRYIILPLIFTLAVSYIINLLLVEYVSFVFSIILIILYFILTRKKFKELI